MTPTHTHLGPLALRLRVLGEIAAVAVPLADTLWLDSAFSLDLFAEPEYDPSLRLPASFVLYQESEEPAIEPAIEPEQEEEVAPTRKRTVVPKPPLLAGGEYSLVANPQLPADLTGLPVFDVDGEELCFISHLLVRILSCACRANRHFGLFKDKRYGSFRRAVNTGELRRNLVDSTEYEPFRRKYPLVRLKKDSAAVTLQGLLKWHAGKMPVFVAREANKCKSKGCVQGKCTCP